MSNNEDTKESGSKKKMGKRIGSTNQEQEVLMSILFVELSQENKCKPIREVVQMAKKKAITMLKENPNSLKEILQKSDSNINTDLNSYTFPSVYYSPKDKISGLYFDGDIKPGKTYAVETAKKRNAGVVVQLASEKAREFIPGEYARTVHDAICSIMEQNPDCSVITSEMIHRFIEQNPNAKLTKRAAKDIQQAMFAMRNENLTLLTDAQGDNALWIKGTLRRPDLKGEHAIYKNLDKMYNDNILTFMAKGGKYFDGEPEPIFTVWKMHSKPILYLYASAKNQIAATKMAALNAAGSRSGNRSRSELTGYLHRTIDTMKKDRTGKVSRNILFDTIYEVVEAGEDKDKKSRARTNVTKILDQFKTQGLINDYEVLTSVKGKQKYYRSIKVQP